ncbi:MAG: SpoIIIAH-like family protein [Marvinbryantia sp.]|jgi:stage III sporulation protein AH
MKHIMKKNQIIITALAIMIAVAGYLNYSGTKLEEAVVQSAVNEEQILLENGADVSAEVGNTDLAAADPAEEITDTPGEAVLTSVTGSTVTAEAKLTREQLRAQNKETLLEVINNEAIAEEQKQNAINSITSLTEIAEKEAAAELLLDAKGFEGSVVSITDGSADVVINMAEITDAQRAQIEDIVKRKTEISGANIVITPMSGVE